MACFVDLDQESEERCLEVRKKVGGKRKIRRGLFESVDAAGGEQGSHLGDEL